jgi:hypothetical protein
MKKTILLLLVGSIFFYSVSAQSTRKNTYRYHSINSVGLVNGDNGVTGGVQTVNGFAKGPLFAGIGIGLDYYQYRSIPVFADVRYEMGKKRNKFFAYGNAGINCSWVQQEFLEEPVIWNGNRSNNFKNGFYSDAGIGLVAGFKNGNAFILSLGYSRKTMEEKITYDDWRTGDPQTDINTYRFNRVIVKAGFRF